MKIRNLYAWRIQIPALMEARLSSTPTFQWIFVADHRGARLVRGQRAAGHCHIEEVSHLANEFHPHAHHPASALSGHGAHAYASLPHETEELRSRWARAAAAWLAQNVGEGTERVSVVAPGHLLGALRKAWSPRLAPRIEEHEGELSSLTWQELSQHPMIDRLLAGRGDT